MDSFGCARAVEPGLETGGVVCVGVAVDAAHLAEQRMSPSFKRLLGSFKRRTGRGADAEHSSPSFSKRSADAIHAVLSLNAFASKWASHGREATAMNDHLSPRGTDWMAVRASVNQTAHDNAELRKACAKGLLNHARLLIDRGAVVNDRDEAFERTPLHYAVIHGHHHCVRLLISRGACGNALDVCRCTPLHLAAETGSAEIIEILVREGQSNMGARASNGNCPLHLCVSNAHEEATEVLLTLMLEREMIPFSSGGEDGGRFAERKADYSALQNHYGATPLQLAEQRGHRELVKLLTEAKRRPGQDGMDRSVHAAKAQALPKPSRDRQWSGFGPVGRPSESAAEPRAARKGRRKSSSST